MAHWVIYLGGKQVSTEDDRQWVTFFLKKKDEEEEEEEGEGEVVEEEEKEEKNEEEEEKKKKKKKVLCNASSSAGSAPGFGSLLESQSITVLSKHRITEDKQPWANTFHQGALWLKTS